MSEAREYRVGDEVTVRGVVVAMSLEGPLVEFKRTNYYHSSISFAVPFEEVATHTPKPREFKPGDRVRKIGMIGQIGRDFVIVAINGPAGRNGHSVAWCRNSDDSYFTFCTVDLEHIET